MDGDIERVRRAVMDGLDYLRQTGLLPRDGSLGRAMGEATPDECELMNVVLDSVAASGAPNPPYTAMMVYRDMKAALTRMHARAAGGVVGVVDGDRDYWKTRAASLELQVEHLSDQVLELETAMGSRDPGSRGPGTTLTIEVEPGEEPAKLRETVQLLAGRVTPELLRMPIPSEARGVLLSLGGLARVEGSGSHV